MYHQDFTDNTIQNKLNTINPVFHLIEDLVKEKNKIQWTYRRYEKNKRIAYFFNVDEKLRHKLFVGEGFECVDRHLSVNKFYSENEKDLTCAHYTEKYVNTNTKQEKVVHVYFDLQARVVLIQVKDLAFLTTTPEQEFKIKENGLAALQMLKTLLKIRNERYTEALEMALKLENNLDELSKYLKNQEDRKEYLLKATLFCEKIDLINRYSLRERDGRATIVRNIIRIMKTKDLKMAVSQALEDEALTTTTIPETEVDPIEKPEKNLSTNKPTNVKNEKKVPLDFKQIQERSLERFVRLQQEFEEILGKKHLDAYDLIMLVNILEKMRMLYISIAFLKSLLGFNSLGFSRLFS